MPVSTAKIRPYLPATVRVTNTGQGPMVLVCWLQPRSATPNETQSAVLTSNQVFTHTFEIPSATKAIFLGVDMDVADTDGTAELVVTQNDLDIISESINKDTSFKFPVSV